MKLTMLLRRAIAVLLVLLVVPNALGTVQESADQQVNGPVQPHDGAGQGTGRQRRAQQDSAQHATGPAAQTPTVAFGWDSPWAREADHDRAAAAAVGSNPCPEGMVKVTGKYCTRVRHTCRQWLDDPKLQYARCGEYEPEARCVGKRIAMNFCIDRYEYTAPGQTLPKNYQSFMTGSRLCKKLGKRICTEAEWNFACEGEQMLPYPYGWKREPKCNQDRGDLHEMRLVGGKRRQVLRDLREAADSRPDCVSPFGVFNLVGNLDEPVLREEARFNPPFRNGLKGGWWMAGRNRCRPATTAHDDHYRDIQVGIRCCADLPGPVAASG